MYLLLYKLLYRYKVLKVLIVYTDLEVPYTPKLGILLLKTPYNS
jgi:hypothetical protein